MYVMSCINVMLRGLCTLRYVCMLYVCDSLYDCYVMDLSMRVMCVGYFMYKCYVMYVCMLRYGCRLCMCFMDVGYVCVQALYECMYVCNVCVCTLCHVCVLCYACMSICVCMLRQVCMYVV